ncbi:hypothetical protein ABI924_22070, partial [Chromobacterium phragmitis]
KAGYYRHEMSDDDHRELLAALLELDGFVVLSGYPSDLYNRALTGWEQHSTGSRISAGRGTAVRTECVWLNPACSDALRQFGQPRNLELFSA